jgi:hypothetical protein
VDGGGESESHGEAEERREWRRALSVRVFLTSFLFIFCPSENPLVFGLWGRGSGTVWLELGGREEKTLEGLAAPSPVCLRPHCTRSCCLASHWRLDKEMKTKCRYSLEFVFFFLKSSLPLPRK